MQIQTLSLCPAAAYAARAVGFDQTEVVLSSFYSGLYPFAVCGVSTALNP